MDHYNYRQNDKRLLKLWYNLRDFRKLTGGSKINEQNQDVDHQCILLAEYGPRIHLNRVCFTRFK